MPEINTAKESADLDYKELYSELKTKYDDAQKLLGKKSFTLPDDNSSEEEFNEFLKKIGAPENKDEYQFDESLLFEGYGEDLAKESKDKTIAELKELCHELKLTKRGAKKFSELMVRKFKESLKEQKKTFEAQKEEDEKYLTSQLDQVFGAKKVEYLNKYSPIFEDLDLNPKQKAKLLIKIKDSFPLEDSIIPNSGMPNPKAASSTFLSEIEKLLIQKGKK